MTDHSDYPADYTERDLQALIAERRFLAAADAYAADLIPLGHARNLGFGSPRSLGTLPHSFALTRVFHEVATRIADGRIDVSPELRREFPYFYNHTWSPSPFAPTSPPFTLNFSELNLRTNYDRYLKLRRSRYRESDIQELLKNELFVAAVDAFRQGEITGGQAMDLVFPDITKIPNDLSSGAYLDIQIVVGRRMHEGKILVPPGIRDRHPEAYAIGTFREP